MSTGPRPGGQPTGHVGACTRTHTHAHARARTAPPWPECPPHDGTVSGLLPVPPAAPPPTTVQHLKIPTPQRGPASPHGNVSTTITHMQLCREGDGEEQVTDLPDSSGLAPLPYTSVTSSTPAPRSRPQRSECWPPLAVRLKPDAAGHGCLHRAGITPTIPERRAGAGTGGDSSPSRRISPGSVRL